MTVRAMAQWQYALDKIPKSKTHIKRMTSRQGNEQERGIRGMVSEAGQFLDMRKVIRDNKEAITDLSPREQGVMAARLEPMIHHFA